MLVAVLLAMVGTEGVVVFVALSTVAVVPLIVLLCWFVLITSVSVCPMSAVPGV